MSVPLKKPCLTPEEYLRIERAAEFKSEYLDGEMFLMGRGAQGDVLDMAGGTRRHSLITANAMITIGSRLRGHHCTAYESNLRIAIPPTGLFTYPDISVFCEPMACYDKEKDTATNPTLLVEVLSKTTEAYDRGKKFEHYRELTSLREYLLISQDEPLLERFFREPEGRWVLTSARGLEAVMPLESLGIELPLAEVFDKVDWDVLSA